MARRNVFICDGADCGSVLVNPSDGFLCLGAIKTIVIDGVPKTLIEPKPRGGAVAEGETPPPDETALCTECFLKALGLPART